MTLSSLRLAPFALALAASITACSSAPDAERTSSTTGAFAICDAIGGCSGPGGPYVGDDEGEGAPDCRLDHAMCKVGYAQQVAPDFAAAGCVSQGAYKSG